jgi:hypothetical protein
VLLVSEGCVVLANGVATLQLCLRYSNAELVAINQDPLGSPAKRIVGADLSFPCGNGGQPGGAVASVVAIGCDPSDPNQKWSYSSTGTIKSAAFPTAVLDDYQCGSKDGTAVALYPEDGPHGGTCDGKNQLWSHNSNGTITNVFNGKCTCNGHRYLLSVRVCVCRPPQQQIQPYHIRLSPQHVCILPQLVPSLVTADSQPSRPCTKAPALFSSLAAVVEYVAVMLLRGSRG